MSSSQTQFVNREITEDSSVSEMISLLKSSSQLKEFDEVERILVNRETKLKNELWARDLLVKKVEEQIQELREEHRQHVVQGRAILEELMKDNRKLKSLIDQLRLQALELVEDQGTWSAKNVA